MKKSSIIVALFVVVLGAVPLHADDVADAAAVLKAQASTPDELVAACAALGQAGGPKAQKALLDYLRSGAMDTPSHEPVSLAVGEALAAIGGPAVEKALITQLGTVTGSFKDNAVLGPAQALGLMKSAKAVKPLLAALKLEYLDGFTYTTIAAALEKIGDKTAAAGLAAALKVKDEYDRYPQRDAAIIHAIGALGGAGSAAAIAPLLRDPDAGKRAAAFDALGVLGWKPQSDDDKVWVALQEADWDSLAGFGPRAIPALIVALSTTDHAETARKMLVEMGPQAIPALISASAGPGLSHGNGPNLAAALGAMGAPAWDPLVAALKSADAGTRGIAVEALGFLGDARAAPLVARYLAKENNREAAGTAAEALLRLGAAGAEPLYGLLSGRDENARFWSAYAFCQSVPASEQRVTEIGRASQDKDVRGACAWVLSDISSTTSAAAANELLGGAAKGIWPQLVTLQLSTGTSTAEGLLNSSDPRLRAAAELWAAGHGYRIMRY